MSRYPGTHGPQWHRGIDESSTETGHNGQVQTFVCRQTKGVQSVDVISEERILGKFSHQGGRRPSVRSETLHVTKTPGAPLANTLGECPLWGGGGDR